MGIFSFFKKSGKKVLDEQPAAAAKDPAELRVARQQALEKTIFDSDLAIDNFCVDLEGDVVIATGEAHSQADKEKAVLMLGNVAGIASVDDRMTVAEPEPESVFYEVKSGDSLSKIAKAHYGDAMKYMAIFEANQPMLKDPNLIYPGQMLRIPPVD